MRGRYASTDDASFRLLVMSQLHAQDPASGITPIWTGQTGLTAAAAYNTLYNQVPMTPANLVIVELGTNDYLNNTLSTDFATDYGLLLELLGDRNPTALFLCCQIWAPNAPNAIGNYPDPYNNKIATAAGNLWSTHGLIGHTVAITPLYQVAGNRGPAGVCTGTGGTSDTFHPNDTGHAAIASAIMQRIGS